LNGRASLPCSSTVFAGLSADILQQGKSLRFRAHGARMQPLVRDGDCLLVQPVEAGQVRVGDVVLCSSQADHVVVHRVLRRQPGPQGYAFLVQGDQVAQPDGWIPQARVYGRVTALERAGITINMYRPLAKVLGWLAALRSLSRPARSRLSRLARQLSRR
jgi:signal peptidase I